MCDRFAEERKGHRFYATLDGGSYVVTPAIFARKQQFDGATQFRVTIAGPIQQFGPAFRIAVGDAMK